MTPWIQTRYGNAIDLTPPAPESLVLRDLAFAVAHLNRYTGHAGVYSVAQHLVLGAVALREEGHSRGIQASYLLHDLHEAICGDVSSPGKRAIRAYYRATVRDLLGEVTGVSDWDLDKIVSRYPDPWTQYEEGCARAVRLRFGVPIVTPAAVKIADVRMLLTEKRDRFADAPRDRRATLPEGYQDLEPYAFPIYTWPPDVARTRLLEEAERLDIR